MFKKKTQPSEEAPKPKKSFLREWSDSLLFAVVAATLIRFLTFEAFAIPTPSMENTLMVGDYLFVSKLHYGIRTPRTPLQVPLTHQKIWGTDIPSYSDAIQLPVYRTPGFSEIKSGDVVVFNYPPRIAGEPDYPADLKTNYIKRCIGTPGDRIEVRQEKVLVNGREMATPPRAETFCFVKTKEDLNERFFRRYDIFNDFNSPDGPFINWQPVEIFDENAKTNVRVGYNVNMTQEVLAKFRAMDWIEKIETTAALPNVAEPGIYGGAAHSWNRDNYGPLTVPKQGATVPINEKTIAVYGPVIERYEDNENVQVTPTSVSVGGKAITSYTFKQDYYFMMGDNRHNSEDSRYWGFVPSDHIVGKAVFVWMSIDPVADKVWNKIRWNRLFRVIE